MSMFQILNFLTDNAIDLLNNTFALVGRTYGFMLDISTSSSTKNLNDYILGLTQSFYTIAGIFMLFRLSISVFGYILDPDKMTDSKTGGGKLLTNVVFTMILIIGFYPNGFIFNALQNIEDVFLSQAGTGTEEREDGFISNIFNKIGVQTKKKESGFNDNKENSVNNLLLENVNAANKKTCYYSEENNEVDEIVFTTDSDGRITGLATNLVNNRRTVDNSAKGKKDCNSLAMVFKSTDFYYYHIVDKSTVPEDKSKWASDIEWIHQVCEKKENCTGGRNKNFFSHQLNSAEAMFANGVAGAFYSCNMNDSDAKEKYQKAFNKAKSDSSELSEFFEGLEYKGKEDAKSKELCNAFEEHPLYIPEAGKKGKELIEDGGLDAYFFAGVVFSLIATAYLIILCLEVIIRNLKLTLFQIIAPIPLINGIDPNDKMRTQWFKSYFGAYLDLFFKIFAIQLLARITPAISDIMKDVKPLGKLFFIIALLTFAKMVPNLISKILGIEDFGGSLKTTGGMLKKGLGIGAGMAIGGALGGIAGGVSGKGFRGTTAGIAKGVVRGANSGMKGKYAEGARKVAESNKLNADLKDQGVGFMGRVAAQAAGGLGIASDYAKKKEELEVREQGIMAEQYKTSYIDSALSNLKGFKDEVTSNMESKSGIKGYEGVQAVDEWRAKKAATESAVATGDYDIGKLKQTFGSNEVDQWVNQATYTDENGETKINNDTLLARMQSSVQSAKKDAIDAAQEEEVRRINAGKDYSEAAFNYKANYDRNLRNIDEEYAKKHGLDLQDVKVWSSASDISSDKDSLEKASNSAKRDTEFRKRALDEEKRELEISAEKAKHDAFHK